MGQRMTIGAEKKPLKIEKVKDNVKNSVTGGYNIKIGWKSKKLVWWFVLSEFLSSIVYVPRFISLFVCG